jgi:hypothetical protein
MSGLWVSARSWARRPAVYLTVFIVLLFGAGAFGYLIGSSSGGDVGAARQAGTEAGQKDGSTMAARKAYARGRALGRSTGFADAYPAAYEAAFLKQFRRAGLDAPARVSVPDPAKAAAGQGAKR